MSWGDFKLKMRKRTSFTITVICPQCGAPEPRAHYEYGRDNPFTCPTCGLRCRLEPDWRAFPIVPILDEWKTCDPEEAVAFFDCCCQSLGHALRLELHTIPDWAWLTLSMSLRHYRRWYKRLWLAIRYIFGRAGCDHHYDDFEFRAADMDRMISMLHGFRGAAARCGQLNRERYVAVKIEGEPSA